MALFNHGLVLVDRNQHRKRRASDLAKLYHTHIEQLTIQIIPAASKLSTPITSPPTQQNSELVRELGFVRSTQGPPTPIPEPTAADFDTNPWSRDAAPEFGWTPLQNENSSINQIDLIGHGGHDPRQQLSSQSLDTTEQGPRPFAWESDAEAKECRRCARRFGLIVRRHHCRRCGLIVCDRCSTARAYLTADEILQDPKMPSEPVEALVSQHQRVCDKCYADLGMRSK